MAEPARSPDVRVDISVVVPAHQAQETLGATLDALGRSEFAGASEVVVVDDASTDRTAAVAEAADVRVVRLAQQAGPAAARNAGVAAARGVLLAFTDADCQPARGWLAAVARGLEAADLVTGPILPDPGVVAGPWDRTLHVTAASPLFETANLGVRRALYERIGGFEAFAADPRPGLRPRAGQGHFGEDAVFGARAVRAGARVAFLEDAVVHHAVWRRGPRAFVAERWRRRFFPALAREVPELSQRRFLSPRTARFDAAVAGTVVAGVFRQPATLLAVVPYLARDLRRDRPWRRSVVRHNAVLVSADAVSLAALLCGSVAARRVLL